MATNNVMKKLEIKAANNLLIDKDLGAEAQNIDVSFDANGDIIEDISITTPISTEGLPTVLKQTQGAVTWTEENILGAKNLIPMGDSVAASSANGISYTVANDGVITIAGYASAESRYTVEFPEALNGAYKFTIDCANFNVAGIGTSIILKKSNGTTNVAWFGSSGETDGTKEISIPANSDVKYFTIIVTSGASVINLVIKPMLRLASIKNRTYVPYAKTNKELTKDIKALANRDTGHAIMNAYGIELDQRHNLQFIDSKASDDESNNKTKIEVVQSITKAQFNSMPDGIYNIFDEDEESLKAEDIGYNNLNSGLTAENLQDAVDQICTFQMFNIPASSWIPNTDSTTNSDYPYVSMIATDLYTDDDKPIWQMGGVGMIPTNIERNSIDMVLEAIFSGAGVILYATALPNVALTLEVKGNSGEVNNRVYLYKYSGNPCISTTGGWNNDDYTATGYNISNATIGTDLVCNLVADGTSQINGFGTENAIDLSRYSTLKIEYKTYDSDATQSSNIYSAYCLSNTKEYSAQLDCIFTPSENYTVLTKDISSINTTSYLMFGVFCEALAIANTQSTLYIHKVWLE